MCRCDTVVVLCEMQHIFTSAECADMLYGYGCGDGSASAAVEDNRRRLTMRRILDRKVFSKVLNTLRDCDTLPSTLVSPERTRQRHVVEQENVLEIVQRSHTTSTGRPSTGLCVSRTRVRRTLHEDGLHPFHPQCVQ